jgi:transcriptional regulator with XRE-family HTH domain
MERINDVQQLGRMIRAVRIHAGLSQADAAALCGVSAPFLNGIERGKLTAQVGGVFAVCRGLGIGICVDPPAPIEELKAVPSRKPRSLRS